MMGNIKKPAHLWQQIEYAIFSTANYIFCVLTADRILNGGIE
jgi:hypothetical protein